MNRKDCIHVKVCGEYVAGLAAARGVIIDNQAELEEILECDDCEHFKDRSRLKELPCNVGDTVYHLECGTINEYRVNGIRYHDDVFFNGWVITSPGVKFTATMIGKTVFLTREEAEQALSKRTQKKENEFYRGHCVSDDGKFCKHIKAAKGDNLSNDNTMSCEYGEVNCPYAKPLEEVNAK